MSGFRHDRNDMNYSPSMRWLTLWSESSLEDKCSAMNLYDGCLHSDPEKILEKISLLPSLKGNLSLYLTELVKLSIYIAEMEGWNFNASVSDVVEILKTALQNESAAYIDGYITFYHAKCRYMDLLPWRDDIKCVNYTLFGNFGIIGECTLHYLIFNYSQSIIEGSRDDTKIGILESYQIHLSNLDAGIVRDSEPGEYNLTGERVSSLLEDELTLPKFNKIQARITGMRPSVVYRSHW